MNTTGQVGFGSEDYNADMIRMRNLAAEAEVYKNKLEDFERINTGLNKDFDAAVKEVAKYTAIQDTLLKKSIGNAFSKMFKSYDKKYEANERALKNAQSNLDTIKYRISDTRGRISEVKTYYDRAEKERSQFREYLSDRYSAANDYEKEIEGEKLKLQSIIKEIDEAIVAVEQVQNMAKYACDKFKSAKSWGVADMFMDGILADLVKYNQINSAESCVYSLNAAVARMNKELRDVNNIYGVYCQEFGTGLQFADIAFDNIFTDVAVLRRIEANITGLQNFVSQLSIVKENLQANKRQTEKELEKKRNL